MWLWLAVAWVRSDQCAEVRQYLHSCINLYCTHCWPSRTLQRHVCCTGSTVCNNSRGKTECGAGSLPLGRPWQGSKAHGKQWHGSRGLSYLEQLVEGSRVFAQLLVSTFLGYVLVQGHSQALHQTHCKPIGQHNIAVLLPSQQPEQTVPQARVQPAAPWQATLSRFLCLSKAAPKVSMSCCCQCA